MSNILFDFHIHTNASDGQYSPKEIASMAKDKGLSYFAITDHDTVSGLEEGKAASKQLGINFIPGIEISIQNPTGEFHLLGLGLKNTSSSLLDLINTLQKNRQDRNLQIFQNLNNLFPDLSWEELVFMFPGQSLGRPHFARYLASKKIVKNNQAAFDKFLARGRECYVPRVGANLDEAIVAINESGGIPVIAHPMSLFLSWGKLPVALQDIFDRGVQGLEAFHPGARTTDCFRLDELGRKIGYFITAASDFHGEKIRADRKIGRTCGEKKIDEKLIPDVNQTISLILH